jgi:hypothetical protein
MTDFTAVYRLMNDDSVTQNGRIYLSSYQEMHLALENGLIPDKQSFEVLAHVILKLNEKEMKLIIPEVWQPDFIHLVSSYISEAKQFWAYLLIGISRLFGEKVSEHGANRLANHNSFIRMLKNSIVRLPNVSLRLNRTVSYPLPTICSWVIDGILSYADPSVVPAELEEFIPVLINQIYKQAVYSPLSEWMTSFRCLAALFNNPVTKEKFPFLYGRFIERLLDFGENNFDSLLAEYRHGLVSSRITNFSCSFKAIRGISTVLTLTEFSIMRQLFCSRHFFLSEIIDGFYVYYPEAPERTLQFWSLLLVFFSRLIETEKTLLFITLKQRQQTGDLFQKLRKALRMIVTRRYLVDGNQSSATITQNPPVFSPTLSLPCPFWMNRFLQPWGMDNNRNSELIIPGKKMHSLALRMLMTGGFEWETFRLLWIGKLKCSVSADGCYWEKLPDEIIRSIMKWIVVLGATTSDSAFEAQSPFFQMKKVYPR